MEEFSGLLTATVFLPLGGALLIVLFLRGDQRVRYFSSVIVLAELVLSIVVFSEYDTNGDRFQHVDRVSNWIPDSALNVEYFLAVDGLSAPLVLLTGLLGFCAVFASFGIRHRVREYFAWLLILQTAVMGVFVSLDFILFFLMWELELLPMFFLISIWGSGRKEYSAMKFLIFTFLGSGFMLVGILVIFFSVGTFDMTVLPAEIEAGKLIIPAVAVFTLLIMAFLIKLPVWPFHTWLPDAHTDAPTAVSVMLAGVLLKMGGYGMIRVSVEMFPDVMMSAGKILVTLGVINVLYGAVVTIRQTDLKRLVAFSSISHMGYVLIGISSVVGAAGVASSVGLAGSAMQMFTHGTITGLLFLLVGLIYDKAHTRYIPDLGGLATRMPIVATGFLIAGMASLGLPGTSGFVSELLIFLGTFPVWKLATLLGAFGIVLTAGYILWTLQRSLFGPQIERFENVRDASKLEMLPIAVLVASILIVGIYPAVISDVFKTGVEEIIRPFVGTQVLELK
ncbi:MAG: NADH-quinone oxidoreductase subunit M [SAR202 cluster bacterium]|jgi:NADH-quinone oxidoreductase subunit M|nr:NADH-quinone oxidoreductase subunit M [SAR202 cluster bacterium]